MFLINAVRPEDFFSDGKPCDMLAFQPVVANPENEVMSHLYLNNSEEEALRLTSGHRFRSSGDVTDYLVREWQKLNGEFVPRNITRRFGYYNLAQDNGRLLKDIRGQRHPIICVNDANGRIDFAKTQKELHEAFDSILPEKSSFED